MARRRGKEPTHCTVSGCGNPAKRSLSRRKVEKAVPEFSLEEGRRAALCRDHYKEYKKATKVERTTDRLSWQ